MRLPLLLLALTLAVIAAGCKKANHSEPVQSRDTERDSDSSSTSEEKPDKTDLITEDGVKIVDNTLQLKEIELTIPEGWKHVDNNTGFVLAEFSLPHAESDDADGRLTVSEAGGSIEDNINRWRGQFGNKPEKETQGEIDVGNWKVTVVDYQGEFTDMRGPFAPGAPKTGYRMLAAIIPLGERSYFLKATGPQDTMAAHMERFLEFVKSARKPKE